MKLFSMFYFRGFTVSGLTLISLIHFESFFFFLVLEKGPISFFYMWISSFHSTICWKDCPFHIAWSWHPCQKSFDHINKGLFLGFYFVPLVYMSVLMPIPHCFGYCSFVVSFEIRKNETSNSVLCSSFEILFWLFQVL